MNLVLSSTRVNPFTQSISETQSCRATQKPRMFIVGHGDPDAECIKAFEGCLPGPIQYWHRHDGVLPKLESNNEKTNEKTFRIILCVFDGGR